MSRNNWRITLCSLTVVVFALTGCLTFKTNDEAPRNSLSENKATVEPIQEYTPKDRLEFIQTIRKNKDSGQALYEVYRDLTVIDIHNHDAWDPKAVNKWAQYGIDRIVLFGNISEPRAQTSDQLAWDHYRKDPAHVYPSFAGFPIYEEEGVAIVRDKLEQGYLNIGEIAAASTYSPVVSGLKWKAKHPNDGYFPQIYELAANYRVPILLHIDPPNGLPIKYLKEALEQNPDTIFIFAHANAFNTPENIKLLLENHPNLYIDFFAGFTAYNKDSGNQLQDFVPLMEQYPDRFMVSTDSGYGLTVEQAALAIYETIDLLSPETALKVAYQNYERFIELQPPTDTQIAKIEELSGQLGINETYRLNKRMANELIFELERNLKEGE
ncbi:amidohydrolase family protein [Paenibacillus tarimensis]